MSYLLSATPPHIWDKNRSRVTFPTTHTLPSNGQVNQAWEFNIFVVMLSRTRDTNRSASANASTSNILRLRSERVYANCLTFYCSARRCVIFIFLSLSSPDYGQLRQIKINYALPGNAQIEIPHILLNLHHCYRHKRDSHGDGSGGVTILNAAMILNDAGFQLCVNINSFALNRVEYDDTFII